MNYPFKPLLGASLVAITLLASPAMAQQSSDEDYQTKLLELQKSIKLLKSELQKVKGSRNDLQDSLQASEVDMGQLSGKIERLQGELASGKKQLLQLNRNRTELQGQRHEQQKAIGEYVNSAYRLGQQSQVKLLLNQQDPAELARTLKYYDYFIDARADKIDAYLETISELNRLEPRIEAKTRTIKASQKSLQKRHQQLLGKQQSRQDTLAKLNASIHSKDEQLKNKARDQQRLEALLKQVTEAIANLEIPGGDQPFAQRRGEMLWPTHGPITHAFGSDKAAGKLRWDGVRIKAAVGSKVAAVHHGRVVFSDYLRGHGLLMIVDHGKGYMSLYAHNQMLLKELGDWVSSGETIAKVGNTGGQAHAGLYFEIRHQGKPTNPSRWCKRG